MNSVIQSLTPESLAKYFDHTLLRPNATRKDFVVFCEDCKKYGFKMAAINPGAVELCKKLLQNSDVRVGAAIGFPLGQTTIESKVFETRDAIEKGADEIDYVVNLTQLKDGNYDFVRKEMGRDIFTRLLIGGRYSLMISVSVVIISLVLGVLLGIMAGYLGGIVDTIIMRICDIFLAMPQMILAVALMAILGNNIYNLIFVLTLTGWMQFTKVTRNEVMVMKNQEFVKASIVAGGHGGHIMLTQILPNVTTSIIIQASQKFGLTILVESALSFLNLGIPAPTASWGNMIANGREYLTVAPWMALAPGIALMIAVLAFNFLGDGLRDVLDTKRLS